MGGQSPLHRQSLLQIGDRDRSQDGEWQGSHPLHRVIIADKGIETGVRMESGSHPLHRVIIADKRS